MGLTDPRRALVTGATGFIGTRLCEQLAAAGWWVSAMSRNPPQHGSRSTDQNPSSTWIGADLRHIAHGQIEASLASALKQTDVVFHLGALAHELSARSSNSDYRLINTDATAQLALAASQAGVGRFIFLSSIKTLGERTHQAPFEPSSPPKPADVYGRSKLAAEQQLTQVCARSDMSYTIVRPPLVYGPNAKANLALLLKAVNRRWPLPLAGVGNARAMIGLTNLVALLIQIADQPLAENAILLPADSHLSSPEFIDLIARAMQIRPRLIHAPGALLAAFTHLPGLGARVARLTQSLRVHDPFLKDAIRFEAPCAVAEEVNQMVRAWQR